MKIRYKKIMALLQDIEPPLPGGKEKPKESSENNHYLEIKDKLFLATGKIKELSGNLNNFFVDGKKFFKNSNYIPHLALLALAFIVSITNLTQKIAAKAYSEEIITTNPDVQFSVAQSVDSYTPLIADDTNLVTKSITALASADGFAESTGPSLTETTYVEEPPVVPSNEEATIQYVIQGGDTLSGLGMKFDVKLATLKYVNNIDDEDSIKPGQKLKIPPKGYTVPASLIAKKEKEKQAKIAAASRNTVTRNSSNSRASGSASKVNKTPGAKANGYPYGWCTYYVATRRYVPSSWGNARNWLSSAKRSGYSTGSEPAEGAIVVTSESGWGHVAFVEDVSGGSITISEMNYSGWGVISRRTISAHEGVIRGYVY